MRVFPAVSRSKSFPRGRILVFSRSFTPTPGPPPPAVQSWQRPRRRSWFSRLSNAHRDHGAFGNRFANTHTHKTTALCSNYVEYMFYHHDDERYYNMLYIIRVCRVHPYYIYIYRYYSVQNPPRGRKLALIHTSRIIWYIVGETVMCINNIMYKRSRRVSEICVAASSVDLTGEANSYCFTTGRFSNYIFRRAIIKPKRFFAFHADSF